MNAWTRSRRRGRHWCMMFAEWGIGGQRLAGDAGDWVRRWGGWAHQAKQEGREGGGGDPHTPAPVFVCVCEGEGLRWSLLLEFNLAYFLFCVLPGLLLILSLTTFTLWFFFFFTPLQWNQEVVWLKPSTFFAALSLWYVSLCPLPPPAAV